MALDLHQPATLENIRRWEVDQVHPWLKPGTQVLEIGGADGLQASVLASWGCQVQSIDIPERPAAAKTWFPVRDYDGQHLPFADAQFDVVYSSNVLEHIPDVPAMLAEIRRILRPEGLCVHILPTSAWRFWTLATHYPSIALRLLGVTSTETEPHGTPAATPTAPVRHRWLRRLKNGLIPPPHGEYSSAFAELYTYSETRWKDVFRRCGFDVVQTQPVDMFYTGHMLFPGIALGLRRTLAGLLGSACRLYVLKRSGSR